MMSEWMYDGGRGEGAGRKGVDGWERKGGARLKHICISVYIGR